MTTAGAPRPQSSRRRAQAQAVFRALSDPTRREILALLRGSRRSVGELAANFRMSRPGVSKHVRLLRSAGLIVTRQSGAASICELNAGPLRAVDDWLRDYETFWEHKLHTLKTFVEENP